MKFSDLPALGQTLAAGIFAGLTTRADGTHHAVVLLADKPATDVGWRQAMDWAKGLDAELPTRAASALLFANAKNQFEERWHWTADEFSGSYAWIQSFLSGGQNCYDKSFQARARAVRLIPLTF